MYCARHGMHAWDGIIAYDAAIWCTYMYSYLNKSCTLFICIIPNLAPSVKLDHCTDHLHLIWQQHMSHWCYCSAQLLGCTE